MGVELYDSSVTDSTDPSETPSSYTEIPTHAFNHVNTDHLLTIKTIKHVAKQHIHENE